MKRYVTIGLLAGCCLQGFSEDSLDLLMEKGDLAEGIRIHSERRVVEEATAVEQAEAQARTRSDYGLELRPGITDSDVGVALRIYMPDHWNKSRLREQLILAAESEQLRVSALEWQDLMSAYRLFCEYRMIRNRLVLYQQEMDKLKPYLEKADREVALNQLAVPDRAKLHVLYLDFVNDRALVRQDKLKVEHELRMLVGVDADLDRMADVAKVGMPSERQLDQLLLRALNNRADYQQFDVQFKSQQAAEALALSEDGFRLKYLQPAYEVDYNNGESTIGLSASFILPWGTRNPDITVFQKQQVLTESMKELQRLVIEHRLKVLLKTADAYYALSNERSETIAPLLTKLDEDLELMDTGRMEDLRDLMLIRERMLEVALQTVEATCRQEKIAVEFAAELGSIVP